jgi:hypothetical protein
MKRLAVCRINKKGTLLETSPNFLKSCLGLDIFGLDSCFDLVINEIIYLYKLPKHKKDLYLQNANYCPKI